MIEITPMVGVECGTNTVVRTGQAWVKLDGRTAAILRKVGNLTVYHWVSYGQQEAILRAAKKFLNRAALDEIPVVRLGPPPEIFEEIEDAEDQQDEAVGEGEDTDDDGND